MTLLALDPGMNSPGVALFTRDTLVAAWRVPIPSSFADREDGQRWLDVALEIVGSVASRGVFLSEIRQVVFERPQWYQRGKSKGDPNQLAGVAGVAANVTGHLVQFGRFTVSSPKPAEWIGQLSKACPSCGALKKKCPACGGSVWKTPRGIRIRSRLSEAELALVPDQNDAVDAVGLGLFELGRLAPKSNFSNGRDGR